MPSLWRSLLPTEKRLIVVIAERSGRSYAAKCLHELHFEAHVMYPDMQKLRLCVEAAKESPHHLDLGMPEESPTANVAPELAAAVAAQLPVTHGLATFQLKPLGLTGDALFAHMVAFRARHGGTEMHSRFLDAEMTDD